MAITIEGDTAHIEGTLEHATVPNVLKQLKAKLDSIEAIDLSEVSRADSSGIALLLELTKLSEGELVIENMPAQLRAVAKVYGVNQLLIEKR